MMGFLPWELSPLLFTNERWSPSDFLLFTTLTVHLYESFEIEQDLLLVEKTLVQA